MTSLTRQSVIVSCAAVAARFGFHLITGFVADDAFITYRYAENLASGLGFVYNAGDPVMGTSTPLYTLLLAVFGIPGFPLPQISLALSLAASAVTAALLYKFACRLRLRQLAYLPALCYILWPRSLVGETAGMETALFTLLATAIFYYLHQRLDFYAIGAATLSILTRPEGLLLLALALAVAIRRYPERWPAFVGLTAALLGPWLLFATFYFGSPLPHSITAKLALYSRFGTIEFWPAVKYLLALHSPFGWLSVGAVIVGAVWLWRKQRFGRVELLWIAGMITFFSLARTHLFFWYIVPIYPIFLLFLSAAAMYAWDLLSPANQLNRIKQLAPALIVVPLLLIGVVSQARTYRAIQSDLEHAHKAAGLYLYAKAQPDERIAAEDIGYLGFYSQRGVLDRDGLISPEVVPYNRNGWYDRLMYDLGPDWLAARDGSPISGFINDENFRSVYRLDTSFAHPGGDFLIYRRR